MSSFINKEITIGFKLKSIELLNSSINIPPSQDVSLSNFNFNINIESKADATDKILFVIVSIEIRSEDQHHILGTLSASCIYEILKFDEFVKIDANGKIDMHQQLSEILNSISLSTVRGIMFATFKGTFLHNAFLPIINPSNFQKNLVP